MSKKNQYSAKSIEVLEGLEPVRKRPGMYIGNTGEDGLHHLVNEILDNSIDEVISGYASKINFEYKKNGWIVIKDDGRGIPIDYHPKFKKKRAFEIVLTTLHAGGKFNDGVYKTSGGLHGVGISVVNALSKKLIVQIYKGGKKYSQEYSRGKSISKIKIEKCSNKAKGTEVSFIPDEEIFETISFNPRKLYNFIKMKAVLVKGTSISFNVDKSIIKDSTPSFELFYFKNGIEEYLNQNAKNKIKLFEKKFSINNNFNQSEKCDLVVSFSKNEKSMFKSFCNTIETPDGGSHENAIKNGILKSIKLYGQKNNFSKSSLININDLIDFSDIIRNV